jgi:hypothetical protein
VRAAVVFLIGGLFLFPLHGQTQPVPSQGPATASISSSTAATLDITVNDENGVAVGSASVQLQASQTAPGARSFTDIAGYCELTNLLPGRYELRVEKSGFYTLSQPNVQVGATTRVEVILSHQQDAREVVDVIAYSPVIDQTQISSKEELTGAEIIDIPYPGPNDYKNALNFIPGVAPDAFGQAHIAGAEVYQTQVSLDGFNVTQPATGHLDIRTSVESFRSIEVVPSREPAEYGKGSGGVLGLNTAMGDDHYRFTSTDFIPGLETTKGLSVGQWTPIYTLSGPINRGRAWFLDALDGEYDNNIVKQLPGGADTDHVWRIDNLSKVQTHLTARNILTVSFLTNYLHDPHSGLSFLQPLPATPTEVDTTYIGSIKDQHYFRGGTLLEAGLGGDQYNSTITPQGNAPYVIANPQYSGNYYLHQLTRARRLQGLTNLYLSPHQWHGRHDVKVGGDVDRLGYNAQFVRQPISFLLAGMMLPVGGACLTLAPSPCARYTVFSGGSNSTTNNFETSAYAEDRWLLTNRLLIEPGLRLDWDEIVRKPLLSPRLAGTYILDNESNTKFSAGIGLVYDSTNLNLIDQALAGGRVDYFFDQHGNPVDANGNPAAQPVPVSTAFAANRRALSDPRYLNWSVALEKKLPSATFLKIEFVEKRGVHGFVYNTLHGAQDGTFFLANTRDDRYDAATLSVRHNFLQRYEVFGAYTRSTAHTNQVFDFSLDFPLLSTQLPGPYAWDSPNRFLGWGILPGFRLPVIHKFDIVYSAEARSGLPFNVTGDQGQILANHAPGTSRLPTYYSVNLQFEKRIRLFGYYWALRGGFDNVTNHANASVADSIIDPLHPVPTFIDNPGRALAGRIRCLGKANK